MQSDKQQKSLQFSSVLISPLSMIIFFVILLHPAHSHANPTEYEIKSAYIYNFTKFIKWPVQISTEKQETIKLCIMADSDKKEYQALQNLKLKKSLTRSFNVKFLQFMDVDDECNILYFLVRDTELIRVILSSLADKPILTIGEYSGFSNDGGIIEFKVNPNGKIQLKINIEKANRAKFKVSAQLLEVSSIVRAGGDL